MKTSTRRALFEMPVSERLRLVEDLWDSIASEAADVALTSEQRQELDRRLVALKRDRQKGESWDKVKSRIMRRK